MRETTVDRRSFLRTTARYGSALAGAGVLWAAPPWWRRLPGAGDGCALAGEGPFDPLATAPRARFWSSASRGSCLDCHEPGFAAQDTVPEHDLAWVKCRLCARSCVLAPGERGVCRARANVDGELCSLVYGRPLSTHVDPIEKKPLYHFLPGRGAYSLGTAGCPLQCQFCQNWEISQASPEDYDVPYVPPKRIVRGARQKRSSVIAFTYNEPTVFSEYLLDIARLARPEGLRSVLVSCGFMQEAPLAEMCETLDAIKIDLKGFSRDFYRTVCGAELDPVLRSIRQIARSRTHLEIVNLVVPTLNDSDGMLRELAAWIAGELGPDVPVHFTRFHPDFRLRNLPPTPVATLERARALAIDAGIRYPYVGNVPGHAGNHTYCPRCEETVIERRGFFLEKMNLRDGRCRSCGEKIAGIWS